MSNCKQIEIVAEVPWDWAQRLPVSEGACFASLLLNPVIGVTLDQQDIGHVPNAHGGQTSMYRVCLSGMEAVSTPFLKRLVKALEGVGKVTTAEAMDVENQSGWESLR